MSKTVVGLFNSIDKAESVKHDLVNKGYSGQDITVVSSDAATGSQVRAAGSGAAMESSSTGTAGESGIGEKISHFFHSLVGGSSDEESYYNEGVSQGGALFGVTVADERAEETADLLESYGAQDVEKRKNGGTTGAAVAGAARSATTGETASIPVVEEELKVGKRQVERGGVRVYSRVTERPVEAEVQLREEHVRVERRPVNRPATEADFTAGREQTIELTETAEEAVIGKTSRVVEEVLIGKESTQRSEKVRDTVRKTEVEVEQVGTKGARSYSDDEPFFRKDYETNYAKSGASYDSYAPAYQYGYKLASDPRYANSDWSTVESQARTDWTSQGKGSWESFKAAIRNGWERTRGR